MAEQTFVVNVVGYWEEALWRSSLLQTGLVFVFEAQFEPGGATVDLHRLIYIGEAEELQKTEQGSERIEILKEAMSPVGELCFAIADIGHFHRRRILTTYVHSLMPPGNENLADPFPYDRTTIITTGNTALLYPVITVKKGNKFTPGYKLNFRTRTLIPNRSLQVAYNRIAP